MTNHPPHHASEGTEPDLLGIVEDAIEILNVLIEDREEWTGEQDEIARDLRKRMVESVAKARSK